MPRKRAEFRSKLCQKHSVDSNRGRNSRRTFVSNSRRSVVRKLLLVELGILLLVLTETYLSFRKGNK